MEPEGAEPAAACGAASSLRERTIAENSLVVLLQGLQGHVTTVELRDESAARGRLLNVDAFMNVRLEDVLYRDRRGRSLRLRDLFVAGRSVRYVHIPDRLDVLTTIRDQLQAVRRVRSYGRDGRREFPASAPGPASTRSASAPGPASTSSASAPGSASTSSASTAAQTK